VDADLILLERWRSGDRAAGEELFTRHFAEIYRFFEHKAGADADDLSQRTFMACVAAREQFRGQSSFRTYLFAIARNELYGYLRRRPRGDELDFEVTSLAELVSSLSGRLDRARQAEQLREALRALPAEQQLLLELHYWHELDAAALAEVFATSAATIRVRLLRSRRALREQLRLRGVDALAGATDRLAKAAAEPGDPRDEENR
jgi:RNA polymerase sigma factor (sigma-70 family)